MAERAERRTVEAVLAWERTQDSHRVGVYGRDGAAWRHRAMIGADSAVGLSDPALTLPVAEIYADIAAAR